MPARMGVPKRRLGSARFIGNDSKCATRDQAACPEDRSTQSFQSDCACAVDCSHPHIGLLRLAEPFVARDLAIADRERRRRFIRFDWRSGQQADLLFSEIWLQEPTAGNEDSSRSRDDGFFIGTHHKGAHQ